MRSDQFNARSADRVGENLNSALAYALGQDRRVTLMGQDLLDPYGGAFKISRGLSTKYPESVITTPISESGVLGLAAGMALCGDRPIVEVMFGDFIALGFDMLLNFATKSVAMYGQRVPVNLVVIGATARRIVRVRTSSCSGCPTCRYSRSRSSTTTRASCNP
jgi:pyruvate/2-oxoglutarate/acetoin dehydrogenase E1 component